MNLPPEYDNEKEPTGWVKAVVLTILFLSSVLLFAALSSCATLESIPFSVSYQLEDGSSVTISKPRIIREK